MKKEIGLQTDIFGSPVHMLNAKEVKTYRMVRCGKCGKSVKSSQTKTHLSYGKVLTICKECLGEKGGERKKSK